MDSERFDVLVRAFGQTRSRRQTLRGLAGVGALLALFAATPGEEATAGERPHERLQDRTPQRNRQQRNKNKNNQNNQNNQNTSQSTQGACNAKKCQQGCCAGRTCAAGTSWAQCGTGGAACQACANGQVCATPNNQCASCSTQPGVSVCEVDQNFDLHVCGATAAGGSCHCFARVGALTGFCSRQVVCIPGASAPICATDADCDQHIYPGSACVLMGSGAGCPTGCTGNVGCAQPCT